MDERIRKQQIDDFVTPIIAPMEVEEINFIQGLEDERGESNAWLVISDVGDEYWVFEGVYPANLYKRVGVFQNMETAFEVYCASSQDLEEQIELPDRFHQE